MGRVLYASSNGDRWLLLHDPAGGRCFVRHEANLAAGGCVTDMALSAFLAADRNGPEHVELWRLIGTLIQNGEPEPPTVLA